MRHLRSTAGAQTQLSLRSRTDRIPTEQACLLCHAELHPDRPDLADGRGTTAIPPGRADFWSIEPFRGSAGRVVFLNSTSFVVDLYYERSYALGSGPPPCVLERFPGCSNGRFSGVVRASASWDTGYIWR
jgi:hypothetical protein